MITISNFKTSTKNIPGKYQADVPTITKAIDMKLHVKDATFKSIIDNFINMVNLEIAPKPKPQTTRKPTAKQPQTTRKESKNISYGPEVIAKLKEFKAVAAADLKDYDFDATKHKFKAGDKYRSDFNYKGMLEAGANLKMVEDINYLTNLHSSFEDVNYSSSSKPLWEAIKLIKNSSSTEPKINVGDHFFSYSSKMIFEVTKVDSSHVHITKPRSKKISDQDIIHITDFKRFLKQGVFEKLFPKKKTKAELEAANPKGYANKPKSIAVTSAIKDVLTLPKFKGKISERQAAILYKHFKNQPDETWVEIESEYEQAILEKESDLFYHNYGEVEISDLGTEFIKAVNGRRESLLNQKHNLALFEGLKGTIPLEITKEIIKLKTQRNRSKSKTKKAALQTKIDALESKLKKDKGGNTIGLNAKKKITKGLKSPVLALQPEPQITLKPEAAPTAQNDNDRGDQLDAPAVKVKTKNNLMEMEFETLYLDQGWQNFMQDPAANMKIAIWGKPKNGKTSGALQLANYLTKHGPVLYNFADQGFNKSTQELWLNSGLADKQNATPSDINNLNELEKEIGTGKYKFVFIDMINDYINRNGITPQEFKDRFIKKHPNTSFVLVFETTKAGDFKGNQAWTHVVDAIVTVENFLMENRGRYGAGHFIVWEEGLKKFDLKKYEEIKQQEEEAQSQTKTSEPEEEIPGFCITEI